MKIKWPARAKLPAWHWAVAAIVGLVVVASIATWAADTWVSIGQHFTSDAMENGKLSSQVASIAGELSALKSQDQYKRNEQLSADIGNIEKTYTQTVSVYEDLLHLKDETKDTSKFDQRFADILTTLSKHDYQTALTNLASLKGDIASEQAKLAAAFVIPANVPASNSPPGSGFSSQTVSANGQSFLVRLVAGDLSSTKVIVDTASDGTCANNCPVMSLGDYVARSGAYAGVNGSYFCPATYPSCAGKTNSFDTLLMNKNKVYFNSDNNVYSTVPAVIFGGGWVRFVSRSLEWGRDTGVDGVIANRPMLVSGGNIAFTGEGEAKEGNKGSRSFVANKGNTVYIGVVFNASVAESAQVMKTLGMDNAINLDDGGSTALWFNGYKAGPGRALPNVILFVRK